MPVFARVVETTGPSVQVHGFLADVFIVGGVCAALMAVGTVIRRLQKHIVKPAIADTREAINVIREAKDVIEAFRGIDVSVLAGIAAEFRPNSGTTLHDRLLKIDRQTSKNSRTLGRLWTYSHKSHHDLVNVLVAAGMTGQLLERLVDRLHAKPEVLKDEEKP